MRKTHLFVVIPIVLLAGLALLAPRLRVPDHQLAAPRDLPAKAPLSPPDGERPGIEAAPGPTEPVENELARLVADLEAATAAETPDALVALLLRLGRLLGDPSTTATTRSALTNAVRFSPPRAAVAAALALGAYDAAPTDAVRTRLVALRGNEDAPLGLMLSLTVGRFPRPWTSPMQSAAWSELLLHVPDALPRHLARYQQEHPSGQESESGFATTDGGRTLPDDYVKHLPRTRIKDPSVLQAFFDYVIRGSDAETAHALVGWIRPQDTASLPRLIGALAGTPVPEVRAAVARYVAALSELDRQAVSTWYMSEADIAVRRELGQRLISGEPESSLRWFEHLYALEPSDQVKTDLLSSLAHVKSDSSVKRLIRIAESDAPAQRLRALWLLGTAHRGFQDGAKEAFLLAATRDPAPEIRLASLEALHSLSGAKYAGIYRAAAADPSETVRAAAGRLSKAVSD